MKDFTTLLAPEARQTMRLNRQLRLAISRIVPAAAVDSVTLCRLEDEQLHITLNSASWLSRLRFSEKLLIEEVRAMNLRAERVRWHVLPGRIDPPRAAEKAPALLPIPRNAPAKVRQAASQFEDTELREALQRVAATMERRMEQE